MMREDEKYSWLHRNNYGEGGWGKLARFLSAELKYPSNRKILLIDFGCGRGGALDFLTGRGFKCEGVEISSFLCDKLNKEGKKVYHASIDDLFMIKDKTYDVGFSNDVLEHIPERYIRNAVEEMERVTKDYLFLKISLVPSKNLSREGENLHLTVWDVRKWHNLLEGFGKTKRIRKPLSKHVSFIIQLNHYINQSF